MTNVSVNSNCGHPPLTAVVIDWYIKKSFGRKIIFSVALATPWSQFPTLNGKEFEMLDSQCFIVECYA